MYVPPHFRAADEAEMLSVIREHGFAALVSHSDGEMMAVHLPLTVRVDDDGTKRLHGHVSVANPIWKRFRDDVDVLAIFSGPHSYVSPRWYNHVNVPTWNYITVHAYGRPRILTDDAELRTTMKALVDQYEAESGIASPYRMEELPEEYLQSHLKGIVVFEITITRLEASFKLSQNRDPESYQNVVEELEGSNDSSAKAVAEVMRSRRTKL